MAGGGGRVLSRGPRDGAKEESVPHQPRQTPDVVIVCHGALRCVRSIAAVGSVDVVEAFVVAVVEGRSGALTRRGGGIRQGQRVERDPNRGGCPAWGG